MRTRSSAPWRAVLGNRYGNQQMLAEVKLCFSHTHTHTHTHTHRMLTWNILPWGSRGLTSDWSRTASEAPSVFSSGFLMQAWEGSLCEQSPTHRVFSSESEGEQLNHSQGSASCRSCEDHKRIPRTLAPSLRTQASKNSDGQPGWWAVPLSPIVPASYPPFLPALLGCHC